MQYIALLDDEPDRINAMVPLLVVSFPELSIVAFDNAPDMSAWLADHVCECALVCLDHDLGANRIRNGNTFDPGTGRDVANFLAMQPSRCPVLVHTTNSYAAPGMALALSDAGWSCTCITPYDDLTWIGESWIEAVLRLLRP